MLCVVFFVAFLFAPATIASGEVIYAELGSPEVPSVKVTPTDKGISDDMITWSVVAINAIDYLQTITNLARPGGYELNPFLGRHPSIEKLTSYFVLYTFARIKITQSLPRWMRDIAYHSFLYAQADNLKENFQVLQGGRRSIPGLMLWWLVLSPYHRQKARNFGLQLV